MGREKSGNCSKWSVCVRCSNGALHSMSICYFSVVEAFLFPRFFFECIIAFTYYIMHKETMCTTICSIVSLPLLIPPKFCRHFFNIICMCSFSISHSLFWALLIVCISILATLNHAFNLKSTISETNLAAGTRSANSNKKQQQTGNYEV